jgi:hypothetical protein
MQVSNCIDNDMPLKFGFQYTIIVGAPVVLSGLSTAAVLETALPLGDTMTSSNVYPLLVSVQVVDSLGALAESSSTVNTQSPFNAVSDTNTLSESLEGTVSNGIKAALAVEDYSYLATLVDIGNSLIENSISHAHDTSSIEAESVESVAADLTIDLLKNLTTHLENIDLFVNTDMSMFESTIQICNSFAEGSVLQTLHRSDVIIAANAYATALDALFSQSSFKNVELGKGILQCFDSILSAINQLPVSDSGGGRRLQSVSSDVTVSSTLALLSSFKDLLLLGETRNDTLDSTAYYIDKGWPFLLSPLSARTFPTESQRQSTSSVGSADFTDIVDLFDLSVASEYTVELISINSVDSATCEYDLDPCNLVGTFDANKHTMTVLTVESPSMPASSAVSSTLPQSSNVLPLLTPHDSTTPYELSCPVITDSRTVTVFVNCDEEATLGPAEDVSLVCSSAVQGDWEGECPLYATDVICGNMQGEDISGDNACYASHTSATHSTCVCDISAVVSAASSGQQAYVFDVTASLLLGRDKLESSIVSVPSQNTNGGGGSSTEEDLWYVIMFIGIGLLAICLIYLIIWCIFRCIADDDDKDDQEERVTTVQTINTYDEKKELTSIELVEKQKEDELKTSAQIKFAHNYTQGKHSNEENCYRTAKSYFHRAIEISKEDKTSGTCSIEGKSIALCYFEYAEVLEKLGESQESVAMYKKAYVLDNGLAKSKNDPNKPRTLGELKRQLSSTLEGGYDEDESPEDDDPSMFDVVVPPPRDVDGHVWSPKFCEDSSFCQICDGFINGETEKEQFVFQCNNCGVFGHRDCLVVDMPSCSRGSRASSTADFIASLSSRARGLFNIRRGRNKTDKETGYNSIVARQKRENKGLDGSYHSQDMDMQPEMTNLYNDDSNDLNFTTMEQKVDWAGRKSVALQSVKISNPASKQKSILKSNWSETDTYEEDIRAVTPPPSSSTPPPSGKSQRDKLIIRRQSSDSSDYSPPPNKESATEKSDSNLSRKAASTRRIEATNQDGLTTYEMIDNNSDAFNL